jgi:hypothetical protein
MILVREIENCAFFGLISYKKKVFVQWTSEKKKKNWKKMPFYQLPHKVLFFFLRKSSKN